MPMPYEAELSGVSGFLIDLDGTMYSPTGLLPGAIEFYEWILATGKQFVFLSNTGGKCSAAVQDKLASPKFRLHERPVGLERILTAAEAQVDFLLASVPPYAKLLVISGGEGSWRRDLESRGGEEGAALVATWELRTSLSEAEAKRWACEATTSLKVKPTVYVVFFHDGSIGGSSVYCPKSGTQGFDDWGFEVVKTSGFLLAHGAHFVYTADDAYNPSADPAFPGMIFPLPGPGMFAEMMKKIMYPHGRHSFSCAGKGGNVGQRFMMERAVEMLRAQGHSGDRSKIMMVGDRFDTDVRGGLSASVLTCLVETGVHTAGCQRYYRADPADFFVQSIAQLMPSAVRPVAPVPSPSLSDGESALAENSITGWMLGQGNLLTPNRRAEEQSASLHAHLRKYYNTLAREGPPSVHALCDAATHMGLETHRDDIGAAIASRATTRQPTLDDFESAVEEALLKCGIDARRRWKRTASRVMLVSALSRSSSNKSLSENKSETILKRSGSAPAMSAERKSVSLLAPSP